MDISMDEAIKAWGNTLHGAIDYWQTEAARLRAEVEAKQARIDALMLEHCPDEMTQE